MTIAASVTLYNSLPSSIACVETYRAQVDRLYVVDNSDCSGGEVATYLRNLSNVVCLPSKGNMGVAHALNQAAQAAISDGFSHLLTMDDDTSAPCNMIAEMILFLQSYENAHKVGIVTALQTDEIVNKKISASTHNNDIWKPAKSFCIYASRRF